MHTFRDVLGQNAVSLEVFPVLGDPVSLLGRLGLSERRGEDARTEVDFHPVRRVLTPWWRESLLLIPL